MRRSYGTGLGAGEGLGALIALYLGGMALGGLALAGAVGYAAARATKSKKTGWRVAGGVVAAEVATAAGYYIYRQHRIAADSARMQAEMRASEDARAARLAAGTPATARTDAACQQGIAAHTAGVSCYTCPPDSRVEYRPSDRTFVCLPISTPLTSMI